MAWNAAPRPFSVLVDDKVVIYKPVTVTVDGSELSSWLYVDNKMVEAVKRDASGWRLCRGGVSYPSRLHLARAFADEVVRKNFGVF